jgi:hypothetical protein
MFTPMKFSKYGPSIAAKYHFFVLTYFCGYYFREAGCGPFAVSILTDYFTPETRGFALGIYNWGIYFGYSMSYAFGNFISLANINGQVSNI